MKRKHINIGKIKNMIFHGATWEEISSKMGYSITHLQRTVKATYTNVKWYYKLLEKARANKTAKESVENNFNTIHEVVVVETGYLLERGVNGLLGHCLQVFIPSFCIRELENLSKTYPVASEVLTAYWATTSVNAINLTGKEVLYKEPAIPVKSRSYGIVAVAVELESQRKKVRLFTNSREIQRLANEQGCDIDVVYDRVAR